MDYLEEVGQTQTLIITGGKAKRMGLDLPKCLLEISGTTLIDICIDSLAEQGFRNFVLLLGHGHDQVLQHLAARPKQNITMTYVVDPEAPGGWGKGKAFKLALDTNKIDRTRRSIVVFPDDIIAEKGVHRNLLLHHLDFRRTRGTDASILLVPGAEFPYGVAKTDDDGLVVGFEEKPIIPYQVSVGVYIFEPSVYRVIDESISLADPDPVDLESTIIPALVNNKRVSSMSVPSEKWFPINTLKDYERAKSILGGSSV